MLARRHTTLRPAWRCISAERIELFAHCGRGDEVARGSFFTTCVVCMKLASWTALNID
jgi:hypothetical protein